MSHLKNHPTHLLTGGGVATALAIAAIAVVVNRDADTARLSGNASDRAFVEDMTRHHQSTIEVSTLALKRAQRGEILALAAKAISVQNGEISVMRTIDRDMHHMGNTASGHTGLSERDMGMPIDMPMLESAKPFDRAFMDVMMRHQRGAIRIAQLQLAEGVQPALRTMAQDMISARSREIDEMRQWQLQTTGAHR